MYDVKNSLGVSLLTSGKALFAAIIYSLSLGMKNKRIYAAILNATR